MALEGAPGMKREFAAMERGLDREPRARTIEVGDDSPAKRRSVSRGMSPPSAEPRSGAGARACHGHLGGVSG